MSCKSIILLRLPIIIRENKAPAILIIVGVAIGILGGVSWHLHYKESLLWPIKLKGAFALLIGGGSVTFIGIGILINNTVTKENIKAEPTIQQAPQAKKARSNANDKPLSKAPPVKIPLSKKAQAVQKCFDSNFKSKIDDSPWGLYLEARTDGYKIKMKGYNYHYYTKLYSIFSLLKEAKIISSKRIFNAQESADTLIPLLSEKEIGKLQEFFQRQNEFKALMTNIFREIDPELSVQNGNAAASNFYLGPIEAGMNDQYFQEKFFITKEAVERIRDEGDCLIFPFAIQIQTRNDDLMILLERYYKEFNMRDMQGNSIKTFIKETRVQGALHKSNLSREHYEKLKIKFEKLLFIKEKLNISPKELFRAELGGDLVQHFAQLEIDIIKEKIIDKSKLIMAGNRVESVLNDLLKEMPNCRSYQDLNAYVEKAWEVALNNYSCIGALGFCPAEDSVSRDEVMNNIIREVYDGINYANEQRGQKLDALFLKLVNNLRIKSELQTLGVDLDLFYRVAKEKITSDVEGRFSNSELADKALQQLEEILYKLQCLDIAEVNITNFCMQWSAVVWAGCGAGLHMKLEALNRLLGKDLSGKESSLEQILMKRRMDLLMDFTKLHFADDGEFAMYWGTLKFRLTKNLGFPPPSAADCEMYRFDTYGGDQATVAEAYQYVISNYTPAFIFQCVFESVQKKVAGSNHMGIENLLTELGLSENEKFAYYNEITEEYDFYKLNTDLRSIVFNYCVLKKYLEHEENLRADPRFLDATYRPKILADKAAKARVRPHH